MFCYSEVSLVSILLDGIILIFSFISQITINVSLFVTFVVKIIRVRNIQEMLIFFRVMEINATNLEYAKNNGKNKYMFTSSGAICYFVNSLPLQNKEKNFNIFTNQGLNYYVYVVNL